MQDAPQVIQLMYELKRNGIDLSIDDFGTGYSSLSYLSSFPFNKIKIDKSFVAKLDTSETSKAIVRTIISLAQRIGAGVIAEGVETLEQARILQLLGCRWGQGYYYGRALSADDFHQTLLQNPAGDPSRGASSPAMSPRANAAGNALSG
jgi:EAL domain-containing protein (putative c-di-GMP-specific phosphodiesterase class I)